MPTIGLVLPTASYRGPDFVAAADDLGVDLVVLTDGSLAGLSGRILRVVEADCSAPVEAASALVRTAAEIPLDAVVGVDDAGVMAAALAADELGLARNDPHAVAATRDKSVMRGMLQAAGVPQPRFRVVPPGDGGIDVAGEVGYPLVLKPVSLSGSRGVIKVARPEDLAAAIERVHSIQRDADISAEPMLVEEFVAGPEVAVEALLDTDGLEILAVFDKPDPLDGPFFEETLYVTPSRHPADSVATAIDAIERATDALGLAFGPVHAEVRLGADGPRVIEIAARSIGGLCGRSLRFGMLGQSLEVLLLRSALGLNRRGMGPVERASGAMMIPIPCEGVLTAVRGTEAVAEVEGVDGVTITVPVGRRIHPLPEGDRYLGFIIAHGEEPGDVEASLREAHSVLDFEIVP